MGPIGLLRDGDIIVIDAERAHGDVELSKAELAERPQGVQAQAAGIQTAPLARYPRYVGAGPRRRSHHHRALTRKVRCYAIFEAISFSRKRREFTSFAPHARPSTRAAHSRPETGKLRLGITQLDQSAR